MGIPIAALSCFLSHLATAGGFVNGCMQGLGVLQLASGDEYEGEMAGNKFQGGCGQGVTLGFRIEGRGDECSESAG